MFDRFTKPARDVVVNAQREARALGHSYIGTEHQLLGLLADRRSGASRVLKSFGVTAKRVRKQLVQIVKPGETPVEGSLPFTAAAKQVHELAFMEAKSSGSDVTPEHLLLGLVREREGVATQVLLGLGADPNAIGTALMSFLRGPSQPGSPIPRARRLRLRWSRLTR